MRLTALTLSILLGALLLHVVTAVVKRGSCPGAPVRPAYCDPSEMRDRCNDDFVCMGSKKCCPTYCLKKCTERGPVKFGSCPVVNASFALCEYPIPKKCAFDSHCPGIQKCCDAGCIIRCADPWVPARQSIKPGKCPVSPIPFIPCPPKIPKEHRHCNNDRDCKGKQKCCPYVCQYLCKDPAE